jgi:dynein heavy chain 2
MKDEFAAKTGEASMLRTGLQKVENTLQKAEHLLGQLSGEQVRWSKTVKTLQKEEKEMPAQMLLASAFTTFLGKTSEDLRNSMVERWQRVCDLDSFSYTRLLSTESELLQWKAMSLPSDNLSMENALVISNSNRVPFIIDPANASTEWLKAQMSTDEKRPIAIVNSPDIRFTSQVEQAVRFGKTLVILEVDGVEPLLFPLVRKDLQHQGPRWVVRVGDKVVDYNENFRMFLVTRNPHPDLPPDAAALVAEVNFTVTKSGLEGQLLGVTIQNEQPELEQQKSKLLKQEEDFKVQLAALEKELLETLATSEGDILENVKLIESLTQTKETSKGISDALQESEQAGEELDRQREGYRPFAADGSTLFFLMGQLVAINHMYQFSLAAFLVLFRATLSTEMDAGSVSERIRRLTPMMEQRVLFFVGRSLFKQDRPMFGMHLVKGMHPDLFKEGEWDFFLGNFAASDSKVSLPTWAAPDRAKTFGDLSSAFADLVRGMRFNDDALWSRWARDPECEHAFPADISKQTASLFQRVLVVQALRPDRLMSAMTTFVCSVMELQVWRPTDRPTDRPDCSSCGVHCCALCPFTVPKRSCRRSAGAHSASLPICSHATAHHCVTAVSACTGILRIL